MSYSTLSACLTSHHLKGWGSWPLSQWNFRIILILRRKNQVNERQASNPGINFESYEEWESFSWTLNSWINRSPKNLVWTRVPCGSTSRSDICTKTSVRCDPASKGTKCIKTAMLRRSMIQLTVTYKCRINISRNGIFVFGFVFFGDPPIQDSIFNLRDWTIQTYHTFTPATLGIGTFGRMKISSKRMSIFI